MLDEQGKLLPHKWVTGDDELGKSSSFRRALRQRDEQYCLAVPSDTNVRDLDNVPEYTGCGQVQSAKIKTLCTLIFALCV